MTCNWYFFAQTSLIHVYWKDTNANMECKHQYDLDSSKKGHFRVVSSFCFKARLSAKPLIRKLFFPRANKTHFHKEVKEGFALSLVLKVRIFELGNGLLGLKRCLIRSNNIHRF